MTTPTPKAAPALTPAAVDRLFNEAVDQLKAAVKTFDQLGNDRAALQASAILCSLLGALLSGEHAAEALDNLSTAASEVVLRNQRLLTRPDVAERVN